VSRALHINWDQIVGGAARVAAFVALAEVAALAQVQRPADEAAFSALPHTIEAKEKSAPNSIILQQMRRDGRNEFCATFKRYTTFRNWIASVKNISDYDFKHTAELGLDIGDNIALEEEVADTTALYKTISGLREGQTVIISGSFDHDNDDSACTYFFGPFQVHLSGLRPM
jgi:hypothetical protein